MYTGELFCGNVAYVVILRNASWRWPVLICGVAVTAVSVALAILIEDPPVGKFVNQRKVHAVVQTQAMIYSQHAPIFLPRIDGSRA